jgi:Pyridoxamine 5'-phosphate oxidase
VRRMITWADIERDAPDFAAAVRRVFDAGTNKTIATIRGDGSPRISGTELGFVDGQVLLGMMPDSRKRHDVRRDPRVAIHSPTLEPPKGSLGGGDAKIAGVLVDANPGGRGSEPESGTYHLDVREVVLTTVEGDELVIRSWHPDTGLRETRRR